MEIESVLSKNIHNYQDRTYFLAVSGGVDSMIVLHLFLKLKLRIKVLHVNYNLRQEASDLDQKLVEKICRENKIDCIIHNVEEKDLKSKTSGNLQSIARDIRYTFFAQEMKNTPESILVLGHHKNDQAETVLINLSRKSGLMGLSAMLVFHRNKLRPILGYTKDQIYAFAKNEKIEWREDQSNAKNDYQRNFLRNEILPLWQNSQEDIIEKLADTALFYQGIQAEIEMRILNIIGVEKSISIVVFQNMLSFEKAEVLRQWNFPIHFIDAVSELGFSQVGKFISFSNFCIYRERTVFRLVEATEAAIPEIKMEVVQSFEKGKSEVAFLDESKINGTLHLRKWQIGDKMQVLGMTQSKLISDILSNEKVESHAKSNVLVLADDVIIHWLVGVRVSEVSKVRPETQNILKISLVAHS